MSSFFGLSKATPEPKLWPAFRSLWPRLRSTGDDIHYGDVNRRDGYREPLPRAGKRDIAPTHVPRLPRPSTALYIRFLTWAWTFMTLDSDVTVKNTPLSANFSALGAMILHLALQGLSRQM